MPWAARLFVPLGLPAASDTEQRGGQTKHALHEERSESVATMRTQELRVDVWHRAAPASADEAGDTEMRTCKRCGRTLPRETHFPHGASWCTVCVPPDDDSD